MKHIFSIIIEQGLGLPTGTIAFWGTLVPRILTVDHTFKLFFPFNNQVRLGEIGVKKLQGHFSVKKADVRNQ